jgi:thioredoxin 1
MSKVISLDDTNFGDTVKDSDKPIFVDFWAEWCGPCRVVSPIVDELADEYSDKITFAKVNVDLSPQSAAANEVMSIPTLILFKDGKEEIRVIGSKTKSDFVKELEQYL